MKKYCFDIDGVLIDRKGDSRQTSGCAYSAKKDVIEKVNKLYDEGNYIIVFTARGTETGVDWSEFTLRQLEFYNVKFHKLIFGKPDADFYIDDKNLMLDDL